MLSLFLEWYARELTFLVLGFTLYCSFEYAREADFFLSGSRLYCSFEYAREADFFCLGQGCIALSSMHVKQTSFCLGQGCIALLSKHVKQTFLINISLVFQFALFEVCGTLFYENKACQYFFYNTTYFWPA